tara:strand:+ start:601 stop:993 length:393 start_codon:yes stop_codon:yes gene_type:complete
MYDLGDLFHHAEYHQSSVMIEDKGLVAYMLYGWRIIKEKKSGNISIINMSTGGDFYTEANENEYKTFKDLGWKKAIYVLYLSNCRIKLAKIDNRINVAIVKNDNIRLIRKLKASREQVLKNFNKVKSKLN